MFEGLLMHRLEVDDKPRGFFRKKQEELTEEEYIAREVRLWKANELPLKSVIHMVTKLGIGVEVYTYLDPILVPSVESWLARKGADVQVWSYFDINEMYDDFKYNRDVHTFFTTSEDDARRLGIRATVVLPDGTFGI
jgi:hypothetical protein